MGASPTKLEICFGLSVPNSGKAESRVVATTLPTPGRECQVKCVNSES
jgi:hypothetical protein